MAIKPETVKLFDQIASKLDEADKAQLKIVPKLKELEPKVRADAKLDKPKLGEVHTAALGKLVRDIDAAKPIVKAAEEMISQVLKDRDFVDEKLKEIEAIKKRQEDAGELLSAQYMLAKELENLAEESNRKGKSDADDLFDYISQVELMVDELKDLVEDARSQVVALRDRAYAAHAARDAKALADVQKQVTGIETKELKAKSATLKMMAGGLQKLADAAQGLDSKGVAQARDSINDVKRLLNDCDLAVQETESLQPYLKSLIIPTIDLNKAMKVLNLPSSAKDKLAKVLKSPADDFEKGLDDLAKALKLKDPAGKPIAGKDLVAALKKAKVI